MPGVSFRDLPRRHAGTSSRVSPRCRACCRSRSPSPRRTACADRRVGTMRSLISTKPVLMRAPRSGRVVISREKIDAPSAKLAEWHAARARLLHRERCRAAIAATPACARRVPAIHPRSIRSTISRRGAMHVAPSFKRAAEFQRAHHQIDIGICENDHRIFARKFHDCGRVGRREAGENVAAVFG